MDEEIYAPEEYELISPAEDDIDSGSKDLPKMPEGEEFRLPVLYKKDAKDHVRIWTIYFDGEELISISGIQGSDKLQTARFEVIPKAKRNLIEQALSQARSKYHEKFLKNDYRTTVQESKNRVRVGAMLCAKYDPEKTKINFPVGVQEKLNGVRLFVDEIDGETLGFSRRGTVIRHLKRILKDANKFLEFLPEKTRLDGEAYKKGVELQTISSWFRAGVGKDGRITSGYKQESEQLLYYIYDIITPLDENYRDRYNMLVKAYNQYLRAGNKVTSLRIHKTKMAQSREEIDELMDTAIEEGYEGLVVRKICKTDADAGKGDAAKYREGRGNRIFKYKRFVDEEAEIVGVEEGKDGESGLAILVIKDIRGNTFRIRPSETFKTRKEWFENPDEIIGKEYTFKYLELSKDGVPQTISGVGIRDYE